MLFDSGQAPLLLDLVSYDTVKTLRGVLKYEVKIFNKFYFASSISIGSSFR